MALTAHQLEAALMATRQDAAQAAATERERIERDLHDGAQQRLLALRMKLGVVQRLLDADPAAAASLLGETGPDIDAALMELRALAHGIVPGVLLEGGLAPALVQLARHSACQVHLKVDPVGRFDRAIEQAVYFCCAEALQNAAKHAGPQAQVELTLELCDNELALMVSDDGHSRGAAAVVPGHGLTNMRERMQAVGGRLVIRDRSGGGVSVECAVTTVAR